MYLLQTHFLLEKQTHVYNFFRCFLISQPFFIDRCVDYLINSAGLHFIIVNMEILTSSGTLYYINCKVINMVKMWSSIDGQLYSIGLDGQV